MKNKIYITTIIFGLATLFLILFFVWPLLREIKNNSKNILSEKNNSATLEVQSNEIENFKKNYENYKPNLEKISQLFIDPQNPVDFIKFLEDTAYNSGIKPKISLMPPSQKEKQNVVDFQLFSSGDFLKILNFSEKIENGPYLIEIKNLIIKKQPLGVPAGPAEEKNSKNYLSGNVDATFLIETFAKQ